MSQVRIGISGWRYTPWRGQFYPEGLPQRCELWFASRQMQSIEINGTFYSLQRPELFEEWYSATPEDFVFAVKGPRFITHMKKLRDITTPLANFFASGIFNLREKLGPILWQFAPNMHFDVERFEDFLRQLPVSTKAAQKIARRHDHRVRNRTQLKIDVDRPLRHAFEVRHESFAVPQFVSLLKRYNVALVVAETAGKFPLLEDRTADFRYLRLHGDTELYRSGYSEEALAKWAGKIRKWSRAARPRAVTQDNASPSAIASVIPPIGQRPDIYCFFDNTDEKLRAPIDARTLMRLLKLPLPQVEWTASRADTSPSKISISVVEAGRASRQSVGREKLVATSARKDRVAGNPLRRKGQRPPLNSKDISRAERLRSTVSNK